MKVLVTNRRIVYMENNHKVVIHRGQIANATEEQFKDWSARGWCELVGGQNAALGIPETATVAPSSRRRPGRPRKED